MIPKVFSCFRIWPFLSLLLRGLSNDLRESWDFIAEAEVTGPEPQTGVNLDSPQDTAMGNMEQGADRQTTSLI